ncbi:MAG: NUDIX hydrolase [Candidatus Nanoarchaeia archaeon]
MEHDIQKQIVLKLIHSPAMTFNELWGKDGESNKFAYHLKKLEEGGLVWKDGEHYHLTSEGKKLSAFIEGDTGGRADFPTLTVILLVKQGAKYLCQRRLKEPFHGYWGFVSGKINFGLNVFECATRDLLEESGLHSDEWQMKALEQVKTYDENGLLHHHYLFIVQTEKITGELLEKTHKAEHEWLTVEEYKAKEERFPSEWFFDHILPAKKPMLLEAERFMEKGKFVGGKATRVDEF